VREVSRSAPKLIVYEASRDPERAGDHLLNESPCGAAQTTLAEIRRSERLAALSSVRTERQRKEFLYRQPLQLPRWKRRHPRREGGRGLFAALTNPGLLPEDHRVQIPMRVWAHRGRYIPEADSFMRSRAAARL